MPFSIVGRATRPMTQFNCLLQGGLEYDARMSDIPGLGFTLVFFESEFFIITMGLFVCGP
jgi:hypothetical protein